MQILDLRHQAQDSGVHLVDISSHSFLALCGHAGESCRIVHLPTENSLSIPMIDPPRAIAFRPACNELAIARSDCISRLTASPSKSGTAIIAPARHLDVEKPVALAFNNDGTLLAAGCADGTISIWRLDDASTKGSTLEHRIMKARLSARAIVAMCFVQDDSRLVAVDGDGRSYLVTLDDECGRVKAKLLLAGACGNALDWHCYCVCAHPSKLLVALAGESDIMWMKNLSNGALFALRTGLGKFIHKMAFVGEGRQLAVAGEKGVIVYEMDATVLKHKWMYLGDYNLAGRAVLLPRQPGQVVATFEEGRTIRLMKEVNGTLVMGWS